jgi:phage terminase small subunit
VPLTPKQQRFVDEYLIDLNATQAAIRAGYSAKNADKIGPELLGKTRVAEAIRRAKEKRSARTEIKADRIVKELARIAFLDARKVMKWGPDGVTFHDSDELGEDEAAVVTEASQTVTENGGTIRVKLADKIGALTLLGKHLGMFIDKVQVDGTGRLLIEEIVDDTAAKKGPPPPDSA